LCSLSSPAFVFVGAAVAAPASGDVEVDRVKSTLNVYVFRTNLGKKLLTCFIAMFAMFHLKKF
jgi:hypothetical protein